MNVFSNIGIAELIFILILALLVVGPERLPELARQAGKLLRDLRRAYDNLTRDLGPEFTSIQKTTLELRESVDAVRSIPQDLVRTVTRAADLEDTTKEVKEAVGSLQQVAAPLSGVASAVKEPVQSAVIAAQGALRPGKPKDQSGESSASDGEPDVLSPPLPEGSTEGPLAPAGDLPEAHDD